MRGRLLALGIAGLAGCGEGSLPTSLGAETARETQPLTVCDAGSTVQGADVSSYQGTVDWAQVADAGLAFSIAKATEGLTLQDSEFQANWTGMKAHGIVRGAYHYFHSLDDGAGQADAFLAEVAQSGGFESGDLPPFLDWEDTDLGDTSAHAILEAQAFLNEIEAKTGSTPAIYSSTRIFTALGFPSQFGGYPFWVASRGATCPDVPSPWTGWLFWQYSFTGTIAGMNCPGACDLDEFNGTLAALQAFGVSPAGGSDAGTDAGTDGGTDGGLERDAGAGDAGEVRDAGQGPATGDGGSDVDGGTSLPLSEPGDDNKGCGCSSGGSDLPLLWILGALGLLRRRR